jgi:signal transduction histidine kinase
MVGFEPVNILMVDDQPAKLLSYEAILADLNENLIKASSGREALDHLLRTDIAMVLLDVSMPELDGFELAHMIRQHPRYQDTAIIFISGVHMSDIDRIRGYQRGAVDYISVPVVPELLRAKVGIFVELFRKTRQLEALNTDLRDTQAELRRLTNRLMYVQDTERRKVARDVHDGLGQYLVAVKMGIDHLGRRFAEDSDTYRKFDEISGLVDEAIRETRAISHLLHPPLLDEIGLGSALVTYGEGFSKRSGLAVNVKVDDDLGRLDNDIETALFRVAQECLLNVHRHSKSSTADVVLRRQNGFIRLEVQDQGKGMAWQEEGENGKLGVGLLSVRERIHQLSGSLEIFSDKGKGTSVIAIIPDPASGLAS